MYFRHREDHYAVGNYWHEPIATPQRDLRRPGDDPLMPSLMPFTPPDFDVAEAEAARLLPALKGRMRPADPSRSINGMFSFTPDAGSVVGESAAVRGFWLCEAVWVRDGREAVAAVRAALQSRAPMFDLVLMDIFMPGLDGVDATREINGLFRDASSGQGCPPIIALTANAFAEDREHYADVGFSGYLAKPFDKAMLEALLRSWLAGRRRDTAA